MWEEIQSEENSSITLKGLQLKYNILSTKQQSFLLYSTTRILSTRDSLRRRRRLRRLNRRLILRDSSPTSEAFAAQPSRDCSVPVFHPLLLRDD